MWFVLFEAMVGPIAYFWLFVGIAAFIGLALRFIKWVENWRIA